MSATNRANAGHIKSNSAADKVETTSGERKAPLDYVLDRVEEIDDTLKSRVRDIDTSLEGTSEEILELRRSFESQQEEIDRLRNHCRDLDAWYSQSRQERHYRQMANGRHQDDRATRLAETMIDLYAVQRLNQKPVFNNGEGSEGYQWSMTHGHTRAQNEGTLADGGALVDDQQVSYITELEESYGLYARLLSRIVMSKNEMKMPTLTGRPVVYFPDEGLGPGQTLETDAVTLSPMTLAQPKLTATRFMLVNDFTLEVLEDSVPMIAGYYADIVAVAFAKAGDEQAFTNNSAVSGPFDGLLYKTGVQEFQMSAGKTTYASMVYDDILSLMDEVDPFALAGSRFIFSTSMIHHIRSIVGSDGHPLWTSMAQGDPSNLFGYPIERLEVMPKQSDGTQNNKPFGLFGNFRFHAWGDRGQMKIDFSNAPKFKLGQDTARFFKRNAFQLLIGDAIARIKTANA